MSAKAAFADIKEPEDDAAREELDEETEESVQVPVAEPEDEDRAPPPQMNRANTGGATAPPQTAAKPGRKRAAVAAAM